MSRVMSAAIVLLSILSPLTSASAGEDPRGRTQLAWIDGPTWYAIAGSYPSRREAANKASDLGDPWHVSNSNICKNYARGLWVVVAGAFNAEDARGLARDVRGAYAKECL
jgi:hypothetical protein